MQFKDFLGKTFTKIKVDPDNKILFHSSDHKIYRMCHHQSCCEEVYIESITGNLDDLINSQILVAEESTNRDPNAKESATWTFYKLATIKGWVDIRWYGSSNGFYSETVDIEERIYNAIPNR